VTPDRARLHRYLRIALVLQAVGLLGLIATSFPDWLDSYLRPHVCAPTAWCMDFRGLDFDALAIFFGPLIVLLLILAWRCRGPRVWPLAVVALLDAGAIFLTVDAILGELPGYFSARTTAATMLPPGGPWWELRSPPLT
jgi:hypothetical protein